MKKLRTQQYVIWLVFDLGHHRAVSEKQYVHQKETIHTAVDSLYIARRGIKQYRKLRSRLRVAKPPNTCQYGKKEIKTT